MKLGFIWLDFPHLFLDIFLLYFTSNTTDQVHLEAEYQQKKTPPISSV